FLTFNLLQKKDSEETSIAISPNVNIKWFYFFLAVTLIFTPLCIKRIMDTVSMFAGENMMYNIRMLVVEGETGWGVLSYSFVINKALLICALWARKKVGIIPTIIVLILMFMSAFALMDKGSLLFIFLTIGYVLYEKGIISLRSIFLTGGALLGIFFLLTLLRNFTDGQGEIQSDELTFVDFFAMYVLSAPVAYGYMPPDIGLQFGSRSLTLLYLILGKLSGNFQVESLVQEFMEVPIPTNLYTIMQPFYLDFGQWGVFIFALLYGVTSGWCYAIYKAGNSWGCATYTFMLYNLVTQYGSEHLLLSPIITIQLLVILYLLTQNNIKITFLPSRHVQANT
ncbi:MAG: O-antigen polymerase, partial [Prevotella sp.]|nr:O-antigen polymerase [Prevotella sp.]